MKVAPIMDPAKNFEPGMFDHADADVAHMAEVLPVLPMAVSDPIKKGRPAKAKAKAKSKPKKNQRVIRADDAEQMQTMTMLKGRHSKCRSLGSRFTFILSFPLPPSFHSHSSFLFDYNQPHRRNS